jgi:orotidine-5'-phosphate decarboxylase
MKILEVKHMSMDRLIEKVIEKKSHVVVGLDTDFNVVKPLAESILSSRGIDAKSLSKAEFIENTLFEYNKDLIDATGDLVPSVKIQIAFYERYGLAGLAAYSRTAKYAKENGLYVIGDIKRGDIGSTSEAYAEGHLGSVDKGNDEYIQDDFKVDSITVNPYLGEDSVVPFLNALKANDGSMFVLARTSNKYSGLIQNVVNADNGENVYEKVSKWLQEIGKDYIGNRGYSSIGAVVGATQVSEMVKIRELMPNGYFLIPGYGAQGGKAEDLANGFDKNGLGGVVNSSRGIIYAWQKSDTADYKAAARKAVLDMNADINGALKSIGKMAF